MDNIKPRYPFEDSFKLKSLGNLFSLIKKRGLLRGKSNYYEIVTVEITNLFKKITPN